MKLLILDDDATTLELLVKALELEGHRCSAFQNPVLGVEAYLKARFDAVITDIRMPLMSGLDVVQALRDHDPQAKVLVLTGHADLDVANAAMTRGAAAFFVKPYRIERILETLRLYSPDKKDG
jgi:DNA-binding NtrC family response regulator